MMIRFSISILSIMVVGVFQKSLGQDYLDEIIFHSNGSTFAPLIMVNGEPEILWTFADSTTSSLTHPSKNYGTSQHRTNRLKVTPWSAIRAINIGYDAGDSGSDTIPRISNQYVSKVEHLPLAAPYLVLWCSSYNQLDTLNFNDFVISRP